MCTVILTGTLYIFDKKVLIKKSLPKEAFLFYSILNFSWSFNVR